MLLLKKNPQFSCSHYVTKLVIYSITHEYHILIKFRNNCILIVDFFKNRSIFLKESWLGCPCHYKSFFSIFHFFDSSGTIQSYPIGLVYGLTDRKRRVDNQSNFIKLKREQKVLPIPVFGLLFCPDPENLFHVLLLGLTLL